MQYKKAPFKAAATKSAEQLLQPIRSILLWIWRLTHRLEGWSWCMLLVEQCIDWLRRWFK